MKGKELRDAPRGAAGTARAGKHRGEFRLWEVHFGDPLPMGVSSPKLCGFDGCWNLDSGAQSVGGAKLE